MPHRTGTWETKQWCGDTLLLFYLSSQRWAQRRFFFLRGMLLCMLFVVQLSPHPLHSLSACSPCGGDDGRRPFTPLFLLRFSSVFIYFEYACACLHYVHVRARPCAAEEMNDAKGVSATHKRCLRARLRARGGRQRRRKHARVKDHVGESGGERGPCPFAAHSRSLARSLSLCICHR